MSPLYGNLRIVICKAAVNLHFIQTCHLDGATSDLLEYLECDKNTKFPAQSLPCEGTGLQDHVFFSDSLTVLEQGFITFIMTPLVSLSLFLAFLDTSWIPAPWYAVIVRACTPWAYLHFSFTCTSCSQSKCLIIHAPIDLVCLLAPWPVAVVKITLMSSCSSCALDGKAQMAIWERNHSALIWWALHSYAISPVWNTCFSRSDACSMKLFTCLSGWISCAESLIRRLSFTIPFFHLPTMTVSRMMISAVIDGVIFDDYLLLRGPYMCMHVGLHQPSSFIPS